MAEPKVITKEYFLKEYNGFRGIMCSCDYTLDQKTKAYEGLLFVYVDLDHDLSEEDVGACKMAMETLTLEFDMRMGLEAQMKLDSFNDQGEQNGWSQNY